TPATPTQYIDDVDPVQGIFGTGTTTNDTTPSVIITPISSNEKATLYVDGKEVESVYDPVKGTLTPKTPLQDGDYKVTYTVTDIVGNESPQSGPINITVDTVAPVAPTTPTQYLDNVDPVQGLFGTGTSTNDQTPGIMIGQKDSNLTATLYVDGKAVESVYDTASGTLTPKTPLVDGNYDFSYSLTDTAGNESAQSGTINITIDTTAPLKPISAITEYDDDVGAKVGILPISTPTDDTKPGFVIDKLASDQQAYLYVDNVKVDAIYDPVKGTLTPVKELTTGDHVIQYSVVDSAGNESQKSDPATLQIALSNTNTPATPTQYIDDVDPVQGIFGTGTTTNDTTPSVVITPISSDEKATLYVGGKEVESVYDPVKGTLTPKTPLQDGDYEITYTVTDIVGNESPQSGPINITVDTVAPAAPKTPTQYLDNVDPIQGLFGTGTSTNDQAPGIMIGQKDSDLTATLYVDGEAVESVYDAASGTLTPKTPLVDGNYNFSYSLTDKAGNESAQSGPINITIDTIAPVQPDAPTQYIDDVDPQTGIFGYDSATNDTTPSFIIGSLKEDETPTLYVDGKPVDAIYDPVAGTLTPKDPLSEGSHDITYSVTDAAGNESLQSNPDQPLTVVIDTIAPAALTAESYTDNIQKEYIKDVGTFSFDTYTNDQTPTINGSGAEAGALITLRDETGKVLGTSVADAKGMWSVTPTVVNQLEQGKYLKTLFITETDKAGNESDPASCVLKIDTFSSLKSTTITSILDDSGKGITQLSTVKLMDITINGTIDFPLDDNEVVHVMHGTTYVGTAIMTSATTWTFTETIDLSDFIGSVSNQIAFTAQIIDEAGNGSGISRQYKINFDLTSAQKALINDLSIDTSQDSELTTTVDNTVGTSDQKSEVTPLTLNFKRTLLVGDTMADNKATTGISDEQSLITTVLNNSYIDDITPSVQDEFTPTLRDIKNVQVVTITQIYDGKAPSLGVVLNGAMTNDDTPEIRGTLSQPLATGENVYIYCNGELIDIAEVTGTTWTYTDGSLASQRTYEYTAVVKNANGDNVSEFSNGYSIVTNFDEVSQGIDIGLIYDNTNPLVGIVDNNGFTNDKTPTLEGDTGLLFLDTDTIVIYRNDIKIDNAVIELDGQKWKFTDNLNSDGNYKYQVAILDADGVQKAISGEYSIVLDTIPPITTATIISYSDDIAPLTGDFLSNSTTNDTSPILNIQVSDVIEATEVVQVFRDGIYIGDATKVDNSNYVFKDNSGLVDGKTYTYTTRVVDAAGNAGVLSSEFNITVDLVAPDQPNAPTHYYDDVGSIQGVFGTDTTTDDTKPAIIIEQIESNESATLYVDGVKVDSVYDPVSSTLTPVIPLENGKYDISYTISDAAGNESYKSDVIVITVNTTAPTQPTAPTEYVDNVDPVQGTFASGTTTNDT
ncbi:Ig-like domain-containing protein, partial [Acinetobacter gerneri]